MKMEELLKMVSEGAANERSQAGQITLGALRSMLDLIPKENPCSMDGGFNFGNEKIIIEEIEEQPQYNMDSYVSCSRSLAAYPSCYRGYYSECTFNCCTNYDMSTVGHVLNLIDAAIGNSFHGYKGGEFPFDSGTKVWGGSTSWSGTGNNHMITGVKMIDGVAVIQTLAEY